MASIAIPPDELASILRNIGDGITVQGPDGALLYANDAAARLCGLESAEELLALSGAELLERFDLLTEDGRPLALEDLPNRRALVERRPFESVLGYRALPSHEERWSTVRSTPILGDDGGVRLVINVFHDVTEERLAQARIRFLAEAGTLLSGSLDFEATLAEVARLLVPAVADYCIVDAVDEEGALRQVVISHRDPQREELLRDLRRRYPPEPNAEHPVSRVLRSGEPLLIEDARDHELEDAAVDDEHLQLYRALEAVSYIVAPLEARGRLLGAISLGTGESGRRFDATDVELAMELAHRAALAIDNALLFRAAQESYAQLNTLLRSAPVAIGFWDRELRFQRVNDALAELNRLSAEEHVGRTLTEVIPELAPQLEPLYRQVLETGEPVVHEESTDQEITGPGDARHWLSSYYPVVDESGATVGVGGMILEITGQRRANARLRLLAEAGELFSSSLEQEEILRRISRVVVPRIADACNIYLVDGDVLTRVAYANADPERERLMEELPGRYEIGPDAPPVLRNVLVTGQALLAPVLEPELVGALGAVGVDTDLFARIGSRSMMFVPFVSRGETLGVITLGSREAGRYADEDLELAQELARRASAALDNARLVRELTFRTTVLEAQQEASPDGLLLVSPDGRILSSNRRFRELWGFSEELVDEGSDAAALAAAMEQVEDPEAFIARVEHLYAHPDEMSLDEIRFRDGRVLDRHGTAVRGPDGGYHGFLWSFRDVTEARRAERELRDARRTLEAAAGAARVGTWYWDIPGNRVVADEFISFVFGVESAVGAAGAPPETWLAAVDLEDRPRVEQALAAAVAHGTSYEEELRVTGRDGARRWILARGVVEKDEAGMGARILGAVADVTERREAAERFRFLAEASEALAESFELEQTLTVVARLAVPRLADYCFVDLVAPTGEIERVAAVREGDPTFAQRTRAFAPGPGEQAHPTVRVLRTGRTLVRAEVDEPWIDELATSEEHAAFLREVGVTSLLFVPIRSGRRRLGVLTFGRTGGPAYGDAERGVAEELARRASVAIENSRLYAERESRAQAATALEYVGDGVFLVDEHGVIRLWNPSAERVTGIAAGDVLGRLAAEALAAWPLDDLSERPQTRPVDMGGRELWLSITAVGFKGGTVYAFRDLTEERAVEQLKSDFVSTVSHELRTPLAAIYGAAMTLRREDVSLGADQQEGMLGVIAGESERLARIVNDILLASRLDSGAATMSIGRADATELARGVLAAAEAHLPANIELVLSAPEPGPQVTADADALRQVLVNLVENAVKYSPEGGRVELELSAADGRLRFAVRDRGLGIPPSEHERIFEKFYRLDPNLSRGVGGTGLGLYISRELVRRMGGRIRVESSSGRGSTFSFDLPLA